MNVRKAHTLFVDLQTSHMINGVSYGPGRVKVSMGLGRALREGEARALQGEHDFRTERAFIVQPGGRGGVKVTPVSPQAFDAIQSQAQPFDSR